MISRSRPGLKTGIKISEIQLDSKGIVGVPVWLASPGLGFYRCLFERRAEDCQHSSGSCPVAIHLCEFLSLWDNLVRLFTMVLLRLEECAVGHDDRFSREILRGIHNMREMARGSNGTTGDGLSCEGLRDKNYELGADTWRQPPIKRLQSKS